MDIGFKPNQQTQWCQGNPIRQGIGGGIALWPLPFVPVSSRCHEPGKSSFEGIEDKLEEFINKSW